MFDTPKHIRLAHMDRILEKYDRRQEEALKEKKQNIF